MGSSWIVGAPAPVFGPTRQLDMAFVTGPGNALGERIPGDKLRDYAYGYVRDHARLGGLGRNASRLRRRSRDDRGLDRVVEPVADHVFALPARIAEDLRFFGIRRIDE